MTAPSPRRRGTPPCAATEERQSLRYIPTEPAANHGPLAAPASEPASIFTLPPFLQVVAAMECPSPPRGEFGYKNEMHGYVGFISPSSVSSP